jgi:hypothetical protein
LVELELGHAGKADDGAGEEQVAEDGPDSESDELAVRMLRLVRLPLLCTLAGGRLTDSGPAPRMREESTMPSICWRSVLSWNSGSDGTKLV